MKAVHVFGNFQAFYFKIQAHFKPMIGFIIVQAVFKHWLDIQALFKCVWTLALITYSTKQYPQINILNEHYHINIIIKNSQCKISTEQKCQL